MEFLHNAAFQELRQILLEKGSECLLLAGAGLTIACKDSWSDPDSSDPGSWAGLLRNGAEFITRQIDRTAGSAILAALDDFDREPPGPDKGRKGGELFPQLGSEVWTRIADSGATARWLAASIGALRVSDAGQELLANIRHLHVGGVAIATTNYENFLADACHCEPVTWQDKKAIRAVFSGTEPDCVAHVHGHFSQPESIVLTDEHYQRLIKTRDGAMTAEKAAAIYRHWIYVGCGAGLGDPNFSRVLRWQDGYLDNEHQRSDFFIGTADDWSAVESLDGFNPGRIKHIPLATHAQLPAVLAVLAAAVSIAPIEPFDAATPAIAARLRNLPGDHTDIKPHWNELAAGSSLPRYADFSELLDELDSQRAVVIRDSAGSGKSILAMQMAWMVQASGRDVHWLQIDDQMVLKTHVLSWLRAYDGLLVLDEAHTNSELVLKIAQIAAQQNPRLKIIALFTSAVSHGDTVTMGWDSLQENLRNLELIQRTHRLRPTHEFYAALAGHLLGRLGRAALVGRIQPNWAIAWQEEYKRQVLLFSAAFLGSSHQLNADWAGQVPRTMALDWINDRYALRELTAKARENLAYLAMVGRQKDVHYGWVPRLALPHPGELPHGKARDLLLQAERVSLDGRLYRLVQSDALGELLETALGEDARGKAERHDQTAPAALAGRLLVAPELFRPLAAARGLTAADAFAPLRTYRFEFDRRLHHVSMRTFATVLTHLYHVDRQLARELIEQRAPGWFAIENLQIRSTMDGAGSLANMLFKCGQSDSDPHFSDYAEQAANIASAVIRRASPERDFLTYPFNHKHLAEVLRSLPKTESGADHFMDVVWTRRFILTNLHLAREKLYFSDVVGNAGLGKNAAVAAAVCNAALDPTYGEIATGAAKLPPHDRNHQGLRYLFQTLGMLYLFGSRRSDFLAERGEIGAGLAAIDPVQLDGIFARAWLEPPGMDTQGRYQTKDWIGLRAALELAGGWIPFDRETIRLRRDRWKMTNDGEIDQDCAETPNSAVAASMIAWLDRSLAGARGERVRLDGADMGLRQLRRSIWDLPCRQPVPG